MVVSPYVGMAKIQNGGYNACISVQTPIFHPVPGKFYVSKDTWICFLVLPQLYIALRVLENVAKVTNPEVVKIKFRHLPFLLPLLFQPA